MSRVDPFAQNGNDTIPVYMLVSLKMQGNNPISVNVTQQKGYSVTPRLAYNSLPVARYLNLKKEAIPDNYIVWMAIKRKEDCTCE